MVTVIVAILRGPLSGSASVVEQGLRAIQNLAINDENRRLLGAAGACKGEGMLSPGAPLSVIYFAYAPHIGCMYVCLRFFLCCSHCSGTARSFVWQCGSSRGRSEGYWDSD